MSGSFSMLKLVVYSLLCTVSEPVIPRIACFIAYFPFEVHLAHAHLVYVTPTAWSISSFRRSAIRAGQLGHITWMTLSHCSSFDRNRLSREYSTEPIWRTNPDGPKIGIA